MEFDTGKKPFNEKWIEITKFDYFIYNQTNKLNWLCYIEFMVNGMWLRQTENDKF